MRRFICTLVAALSTPPLAYADWINLTGAETAPNIAEITVAEKSVEIALEIYLEDVDSFLAAERIALTVEADGIDLEPIVVIRERSRLAIPGPTQEEN